MADLLEELQEALKPPPLRPRPPAAYGIGGISGPGYDIASSIGQNPDVVGTGIAGAYALPAFVTEQLQRATKDQPSPLDRLRALTAQMGEDMKAKAARPQSENWKEAGRTALMAPMALRSPAGAATMNPPRAPVPEYSGAMKGSRLTPEEIKAELEAARLDPKFQERLRNYSPETRAQLEAKMAEAKKIVAEHEAKLAQQTHDSASGPWDKGFDLGRWRDANPLPQAQKPDDLVSRLFQALSGQPMPPRQAPPPQPATPPAQQPPAPQGTPFEQNVLRQAGPAGVGIPTGAALYEQGPDILKALAALWSPTSESLPGSDPGQPH